MTTQTQAPEYQGRHRTDQETAEPGTPAPAGTTPADQTAWNTPRDPDPGPASSTTGGQTGSGSRSTRGSSLERMSREGLTDAAEHAFRGVGAALNEVCAEDRPAHLDPDEIWLPTDDEAEGVAEPTGRLLSRRLPEVPGGDANDAADLIALLIPLGIWAIRGLADLVPRLRRSRKARIITVQAETTGDDQ
jgi:hypothetical protein